MVIWYKLIISVGICLLVGFLSGFFTSTSIDSWYSKVNKPSFNPPNWIFGPVWTVLYVLMGVVLYILWTNNSKLAITFFIIQLVLNFFWSFIFFRMQAPLFAFIEIILLLTMIIITTAYSYKSDKITLYLMLPYILWVSFASVLNYSIYVLNK